MLLRTYTRDVIFSAPVQLQHLSDPVSGVADYHCVRAVLPCTEGQQVCVTNHHDDSQQMIT